MKYEVSSVVGDQALRTRALEFDISIEGNATAADKGISTDLPGAAILKMEGITAEADALLSTAEEAEFAAEADATGIFGLVLDKTKLTDDKISKVLSVEVTSTDTGTCVVSTPDENGTDVLRFKGQDNGHICIELDSSVDFSGANDQRITLRVNYIIG